MDSSLELEVIVIGAGISGIDAAYHLKTYCPNKSFTILEKRDTIGGTWSLFTYPGIRSDSEMSTFGFWWKPWAHLEAIATGAQINAYLHEAVQEQGLASYIRLGDGVISAAWCSKQQRWSVETEQGKRLKCKMLLGCHGYYHYNKGHTPEFKGIESFEGEVVHPQQWGITDWSDKKVVVIGSGATAVTLLPALCERAAHVTMLQRSPSYIVARPQVTSLSRLLNYFPDTAAHAVRRWNNVLYDVLSFKLATGFPALARKSITRDMRNQLPAMPPEEFSKHFTPKYEPWTQRVCLTPNGDFFKAIRSGKASVVTAAIDEFTPHGIRLQETATILEADLVVTATGLRLPEANDVSCLGCSGVRITIDGQELKADECTVFQGVMYSGVPNFVFVFGYTNASWTLKADLACAFLCRLLTHMDYNQYSAVTPIKDPNVQDEHLTDFTSGYFQRSQQFMPKQGSTHPWKIHMNYILDYFILAWRSMENDSLKYTRAQLSAKL